MTKEKLINWFKEKLSEETHIPINEIDLNASIDSYNLDSLLQVSLAYELEGFTNSNIDPTVFGEFNNINDLIEWIIERKK